jgi:hypothetical protein
LLAVLVEEENASLLPFLSENLARPIDSPLTQLRRDSVPTGSIERWITESSESLIADSPGSQVIHGVFTVRSIERSVLQDLAINKNALPVRVLTVKYR